MLYALAWNLPVLAIALIYYTWREGYDKHVRRRAALRQRVAAMLWAAANATP